MRVNDDDLNAAMVLVWLRFLTGTLACSLILYGLVTSTLPFAEKCLVSGAALLLALHYHVLKGGYDPHLHRLACIEVELERVRVALVQSKKDVLSDPVERGAMSALEYEGLKNSQALDMVTDRYMMGLFEQYVPLLGQICLAAVIVTLITFLL